MACFKNFSCEGKETSGLSWGGGVDVCEKHFRAYMNELTANGNLDNKYLEDYARIKLMLERKVAIQDAMRKLANELDQELKVGPEKVDRTQHTRNGYTKVSVFLSRYEHLCWFPQCHHVFLGFIPPENFLELIRQGILAKDPGAGPNHGDFTHRLQWHAISRIITDNFSTPKRNGWDNTPIELLSSLGAGKSKTANAWALLVEKGEGFDHPDNFNSELQSGSYGQLGAQISQRNIKRQRQYDEADEKMQDQQFDSAKARYFAVTGRASDLNVAPKLESGKYEYEKKFMQGNAPVALNKGQEPGMKDMMPIGARIMMSRSTLRNDDGVFCENLGVLARRWAHPYEYL